MYRCFKRLTALMLLPALLAGVPCDRVWANDTPPEDINLSAEIQEGPETVNGPLTEGISEEMVEDQISGSAAVSIEGGLSDPVKPYLYYRAEQKSSPIQMSGVTYNDAVVFTMGRANFNDSSIGEVDYNFKGNYDSLSFYAGYYSGDQRNATLTVIADGIKVIDGQAISWKNIAELYSVDLNGVSHLTIRFTSDGSYNTSYAIGRIIMTPISSKKEDKVLSSNMLYNCAPYDHRNASTVTGQFEMGGYTYTDGIHMDMRYTGDSSSFTSMALFNFQGYYRSLSFDIGRFGTDEARNAALTIQADGKTVLDSETIVWNDIPRNFKIDLTGVSQLIIRTSCGGSYPVSYRLGNIRLVSDGNVHGIVFKKTTVAVSPSAPTVQLEPVVIPSDAKNQDYSLKTDSSITAMVEQNGLVTGRHRGTAIITAVTEEGGYEATCTVKSTLPTAGFVPSVDGWGFHNESVEIIQGGSVEDMSISDYYEELYKRFSGKTQVVGPKSSISKISDGSMFIWYTLIGMTTSESSFTGGNGGLCHGFSLSSALTYTGALPFSMWENWKETIPTTPADVKTLDEYSGYSRSLKLYLKQLIYACHIYQASTASLKNEWSHKLTFNQNMYELLFSAIRKFQDSGKNPIIIKMDANGSHAVLPYEIIEKENEVEVYVYDCNLDKDPDDNKIIFAKNAANKITGWSYQTSPNTTPTKGKSMTYIDSLDVVADHLKTSAPFNLADKIVFASAGSVAAKRNDETLLEYSNGTFSGDTSQTDIVPFTPIGSALSSEYADGAILCPLTDDTFTFVNRSSPDTVVTTLIADEDSAFMIESDGSSQITSFAGTENEKIQVTPSKSGIVSIRYNHGDDDSIQVSGETDGSIEANVVSDNDGISLVGYKNIQVTVTNDGKETTKKDTPVSPGLEYIVSSSGQIKGEFPSKPMVTATPAGDKEDHTAKKISVKKITLSGVSKKIAAGKKIHLSASIEPRNATLKTIDWKSSNPKVATVDQKGNVSVKKNAGGKTVKITATAKDGSRVKTIYKIQVMKGTVRSVKITGPKTVKAGAKAKLKVKVSASAGANKKLVWSSSNKKYATVNASGKITTKKVGKKKTVKITAKATDGSGKKATFKIRLK